MTHIIAKLRAVLANRRAYHRAIAEIAQLDERELTDMGVDRETLVAGAYSEVYGVAR
ncbi:DUF1127 domain-containing protein [Lichenihabitans sp. Uapishka_5]|uniref:DUF1127 domain-containing protein n=1 Tax=Lichenihabitans sp. Uapishka_5 TaxID=3037302 RepID=UPI0029E815B3|nr:DUF1127 domain-containing protein [Lichenihabitans sp. Uapishka_5]MDX7951889.1 DUF1127 domain-containing protein [Lichenihabitans sp. Uapishka_5]